MSYHATIRARQRWLHLPIREIVDYRDLLFLLVRRDFVAQYKQTLLGPLWFIIQPLLTTLVFTIVFGNVAKIPTDGLPPVLFYLCGLLGWGYFAQTFNTTSTTFVTNAPLFGKVYFPRLIVPLSVTISNLLAFGLNLIIFVGFLTYFKTSTSAGRSRGSRGCWPASSRPRPARDRTEGADGSTDRTRRSPIARAGDRINDPESRLSGSRGEL